MAENRRRSIINISRLVSSTILLFIAFLWSITNLLWYLGLTLNLTILFASFLFSSAYFILVGRQFIKMEWKSLIICGLALIAIFTLSFVVTSLIYDFSFDGRYYHQTAIKLLQEGWNPAYHEVGPLDYHKEAWMNNYPKGPWIYAAQLNLLMNNFWAGKSIHLLFMACVYLIGLSFFLSFDPIKNWEAGVMSLVLAANPVSIYQSTTYYVDGLVSSLYIIIFLQLLSILQKKVKWGFSQIATTISALILGFNIKFTSTVYLIILITALFLVDVALNGPLRKMFGNWKSIFIGGALGIIIIGFHPYSSNTIRHGHPFYPVFGSDRYNLEYIIGNQMPKEFLERSWLEKMWISISAKSNNDYSQIPSQSKLPFSISLSEIKTFKTTDVRIGGWGPLFGLMLYGSGAVWLASIFLNRRVALAGSILVFIIILTASLNPEAWWARYTPQIWLIPMIVITLALLSNQLLLRIAGLAVLAVTVINIFLVSGAFYVGNYIESRQLDAKLNLLNQSHEQILIFYGPLDSIEIKNKFRFDYQTVPTLEDLPCPLELTIGVYYSFPACQPNSANSNLILPFF